MVYTITISNRDFPPCGYLSKALIRYDRDILWFAKSENTFWLKHGKPLITFAEEGLLINFGLLPSSYFDNSGEMQLYFLPLKEGMVNFSGELLISEERFYLSPPKKTIRISLEPGSAITGNSITAHYGAGCDFILLLKTAHVIYDENFFFGYDTKIYIPGDVVYEEILQGIEEIISEYHFKKTCEMEFAGGRAFAYCCYLSKENKLSELRLVYDRNNIEQNLHLYMCSNIRNDNCFKSIENGIRSLLDTRL